MAVIRKHQIAQPAKPPAKPPNAAAAGLPPKLAEASMIVRHAAETAEVTPTTIAAWISAAFDGSAFTSSYTLLSNFAARRRRGVKLVQVAPPRTAGGGASRAASRWSGVSTVAASCACGNGTASGW